MKTRRDPFQAIADPTRRAILVLLASQTMSAGAIASHFDSARPTISRHIQILHECELIEANPRGREIFYDLKPEKMEEIDKWLEDCRVIWKQRFNQLDNLLHNLQEEKT